MVFGAEQLPDCNFATKTAFFDAELGPRRGFAMKKVFFDAELWLRRGFATKMVFFDAGRQLEGRRMPGGYGERLGRLWPPDMKNWFIGKDPDAGKDGRREGKGLMRMRWLDGITD